MKKLAILVVSSDSVEVAALVGVLQSAGYRARGATTFQSARHQLHIHGCDLLITDLRLGAYNGLHLVLHSTDLNPATTAIVLSVTPDAGSEREARRLGARYVMKPAELGKLLALVTAVIDETGQQQIPNGQQPLSA